MLFSSNKKLNKNINKKEIAGKAILLYCRCHGEIAEKKPAIKAIFSLKILLVIKKIKITDKIPKIAAGSLIEKAFKSNK